MLGLTPLLILVCAPQGATVVDPMRAYSFVLPRGWRQVTPDEQFQLRKMFPDDVDGRLIPTRIDRFGTVDRWLEKGFDGRCLTIHREEGEPEMSAATLQQVRQSAQTLSTTTPFRYEIEHLEISSVGKNHLPTIASRVRISHTDGRALSRVLEFVIPTGGETIRFSYRADDKDFDAALPVFLQSAATLQVTSPARGRKELSDKLEMPIIIGGIVGLLFLLLYKMRRG